MSYGLRSFSAALCLCLASAGRGQDIRANLTAIKSADAIAMESRGGSVTYKAVVDRKQGGNITELRLPAGGDVVARELNDIFFLGAHGEQYTLRGWTGKTRFNISCSVDLVLQKPDEAVVQVNLLSTGISKS